MWADRQTEKTLGPSYSVGRSVCGNSLVWICCATKQSSVRRPRLGRSVYETLRRCCAQPGAQAKRREKRKWTIHPAATRRCSCWWYTRRDDWDDCRNLLLPPPPSFSLGSIKISPHHDLSSSSFLFARIPLPSPPLPMLQLLQLLS